MAKQIQNNYIDNLINLLARLPGVGPRSARRIALHLIKKKDLLLEPLTQEMKNVCQNIKICEICHNIDTNNICSICSDQSRDNSILVVIEEISDLWALERGINIKAKYHVLGGHLAPLDGITEDDLNIKTLLKRIENQNFKEIILALNATIEGQTTAHYLKSILAPYNLKITQIAQGVPLGGQLDFLDEGTLAQAIGKRVIL